MSIMILYWKIGKLASCPMEKTDFGTDGTFTRLTWIKAEKIMKGEKFLFFKSKSWANALSTENLLVVNYKDLDYLL